MNYSPMLQFFLPGSLDTVDVETQMQGFRI